MKNMIVYISKFNRAKKSKLIKILKKLKNKLIIFLLIYKIV